jgi:hypothetical protein
MKVRDAAMFAIGASGFAHEVIVTAGERPMLLAACLALMGLPIFLKGDEK